MNEYSKIIAEANQLQRILREIITACEKMETVELTEETLDANIATVKGAFAPHSELAAEVPRSSH